MKIKFKISIALLHIAFWVLVSVIPISIMTFENVNVLPKQAYLRILAGPILFYTNYSILIPSLLLRKKIIAYIIASITFLFLFNYLSIHFLPVPQFEELERFIASREDLPNPQGLKYALPAAFSLSIFLLGGIFALIIDFYKKDRLAKQYEAERKEMELQFLRTQLNPHFLFNSLNSIYSLVRAQSKEAPEAVITLSELMRYMLYEVNENKVSLEKELNYLKNYISLQRLRLTNSEDVKLQVIGNANGLKIHPLILITFIENAFKYGTDYKGNTIITIIITIENDTLTMLIKNIIGHYKKDHINSGVGLKNINNQLDYLYQSNYKLLAIEEDGYYKVELTLKLS